MTLTIEQALEKGIEAHKSNNIREADRYYTAILKAQPKHPDANHNMGVLAVGVGKLEAALSFFKTALEARPKVAQFWLSYIETLIKLDRIHEAKDAFYELKSMGANGDTVRQLEKRLVGLVQNESFPTDEEILAIAIDLRESGKYDDAINILLSKIIQSPTNAEIPSLLSHCYLLTNNLKQAKIYLDVAKSLDHTLASVGWNEARVLLRENKEDKALATARETNKLFPNDVEGMGVLGSCLRVNHKYTESLGYLNKAIELNPDYAEALINRGLISLAQGNKETALSDLEKAHDTKKYIKQIWHLILNLKLEFKDFENTIVLANGMIELDPLDERTFVCIALSHQHLQNLEQAVLFYKKAISVKPDYFEAYNNMGVILEKQGKMEEATEAYKKAIFIKPDYAEAYYNLGITHNKQGKLDEALEAYQKALTINPDYVKAYNNIGIILKTQQKLEKAIEAFSKALSIKPDYAEAYNNLGNALERQGHLDEAIEAFSKALSIQPDYAEAYNNMGITLQEKGELEGSIRAYKKALAIKPDYAECIENSQNLVVQLLPIVGSYGWEFDYIKAQANSEILLRPKYQIQNAIKAYIEGDFSHADSHNNNFKACSQNLLGRLNPKDKVFCSAYSRFIGKLLGAIWEKEQIAENKVYHLGESHSLSFAHRNITIGVSNFRITPRITFGAKAFHFSRAKYDSFKAITKAHLVSLPNNSKVFLSYGEIDCRSNEGFISAAKKYDKPLEELIAQTTKGYVKWFSEQNVDQKHILYFLNVPAPVYNDDLSAVMNLEVGKTVALFNTALKKYTLEYGFELVDIFEFTAGHNGFSNGLFHVDRYHLGAKALPEIERQLS